MRSSSSLLRIRSALIVLAIGFTHAPENRVAQNLPFQISPRETPSTFIRVEDLLPDFFHFWETARTIPISDQVELFNQMVVDRHEKLFSANVMLGNTPEGPKRDLALKQAIARFLAEVPPYIPTMRKISDQIPKSASAYIATFRSAFPGFHTSVPVYFTLSLGDFDGGEREIDGRAALVFGIDLIAKLHGPTANLSVLFDHEMFHLYRAQIVPAPSTDEYDPMWRSLWEEGLATYVSKQLNPTATDDDVLLDAALAKGCDQGRKQLARLFQESFDSVDGSTYAQFFTSGGHAPGFPPRSGYYLGYKVVASVAGDRTLEQLAHLPLRDVRMELKREISREAYE